MKQFPILNGKARIVELPAVSLVFEVHRGCFLVAGVDVQDVELKKRKIDSGDRRGFLAFQGRWQIVGILWEVTEGQLDGLVECDGVTYAGFGEEVFSYPNHCSGPSFNTRLESFSTAIAAAGFSFANPHGDVPSKTDMGAALTWEQAQSRVLCRERCLLLRRVDG